MEIRNNMNRLDPYLNRADLEKAQGSVQSGSGMRVNTGSLRESGDTVSFSSAALRELVAGEAAAAPDVRAEKVASIRASLEAGTYMVDSHNIAGKLLGGAF